MGGEAWKCPKWLLTLPQSDTAVVSVLRYVKHPKYKKYMKQTKRYHVHNPGNRAKEGEKVVHTERYYGRQYRSFTLPREVAAGKVEARFNDGVLELTLPKAEGNGSRKIAIA